MRPISLAVDVTNYVMLETRPADPRLRRRQARRARSGSAARREGERLTTLDGVDRALSTEDLVVTDDSGLIGLGGVMGGETTEMSATTTRVLVEAAHWDAVSMFRTGKRHKLTSEAGKRNERGVDPIDHPGRGRPGGRAARRRTAAARPTRASPSSAPPPAPPTITHRLRPARPGHRHGRSTPPPRSRNLEAVGCTLDEARHHAHRDPAAVAPRPHRPLRPGRGGRPDRRLRPGPVGAAARGRRPRPDPRAAAAPPGRPHPGRRRLRRGGQLPVRRRRRVRRARPAGRRRAAPHASGWPTRSRSEEPSYTTTLLPGLLKAAARNLGRGATGVALFETGTVAFPVDRGPAPIYGVDWRPSDDELAKLLEAIPEQPLHLARRARRRARARRLVGRGPRGRLVRRDRRWSAGSPPSSASTSRSPPRARTPVAPGPLRPGRWSAVPSSATPASCTRKVCQAFGLPARSAARRDRPRLPDAARAATSRPARTSRRTRSPRRTSRSSSTTSVTAADVEAALREGAGDAAGVDPALRRLHRRPGRARDASRWPSRCASAPPTGP